MDAKETKQVTVLAGVTLAGFIVSTAYYMRLIRKQSALTDVAQANAEEAIKTAEKAFELTEEGHFIMNAIVEVVEPTPEQDQAITEKVDLYKWEKSLPDLLPKNS